MNYVFDLDGTLCFDGKTIPTDITEQLIELSKKHNVIFASARPIRDMVKVIPKEIQSNIWVGGNGTFMKVNDKVIYKDIPALEVETILQEIEDHNYEYMIDSDWDYAYKGDKERPLYNNISKDTALNLPLEDLESICKIVIFDPKEETHQMLLDMNLEVIEHSNENIIDISTLGCSKANALKELGIYDYVAFGNDANDVGMFMDAQESYCVGESAYSDFADHTLMREDVADAIKNLI